MITIKTTMKPAEPAKPALPERPLGYAVSVDGYDIHWDDPEHAGFTGVHCYTPDMKRLLTSAEFRKFAEILTEIATALEQQEKANAPAEQQ